VQLVRHLLRWDESSSIRVEGERPVRGGRVVGGGGLRGRRWLGRGGERESHSLQGEPTTGALAGASWWGEGVSLILHQGMQHIQMEYPFLPNKQAPS
jgi:hypothetical protein